MAAEGGKQPGAHTPHHDPNHPHHHVHIADQPTGMPMSQILTVGAIIAVVGGGAIWYLNRAGEDNKLNSLFNSQDARKISTNNGQRGDITLSDGSRLNIGPATRLTIIPDYNKQYRGVKVEGTAAFEVKPSPNTPLEVRVGGAALVLDEGALVVRGYSDEDGGFIKLTSGSGTVRAKDARREVTGPVALRVNKDSTIADADPAAAELATSWATGTVVLKDMPLRDVLPLFTKYYALTMTATDAALLDRPVSMEAQMDSKQKALDALQASAFVKFGYDNNKPVLRDDPAAARRAAAKK
jgi:ferric-dicitrate binding protein FerR (iron transport regulator)